MPQTPFVILAMTTTQPTHGWDFGARALQVLYRDEARLAPERIGFDETHIRKRPLCATVEDVRPIWGVATEISATMYNDLYWRRANGPKAEGTFRHTGHNKVGHVLPGGVRLTTSFAKGVDYRAMFLDWCALYRPTQGYLHLITEAEQPKGIKYTEGLGGWEAGWDAFRHGGFIRAYKEVTYTLGALNYVCDDRLPAPIRADLAAQGFDMAPFAEGHLLTLCNSLADLKTGFWAFSARRAQAKQIIGRARFDISNQPPRP